jgi:recombination protein RecT
MTAKTPTKIDIKRAGKLTVAHAGGKTVAEFFEANKTSIQAALPKHVDADRLLKVAMGALRKVPQLRECRLESLFDKIMGLASLGLEPNSPLGHAYLVPFNNKRQGTVECEVIIGYKGFIDLAARAGTMLRSHVVYENDTWEFSLGLHETLVHIPARGNRGEMIAAYAIATGPTGLKTFEWMWRDDIEKIRDKSLGSKPDWVKKNSPWTTDFDAMARKSPIRRLSNQIQLSIEQRNAIELDQAEERQELEGSWAVINDDATETPGDQLPEPSGNIVRMEPIDHSASASPAPIQEISEPSAAEDKAPEQWPQKLETGELVDSAGEVWSAKLHSETKTVKGDGTWRKRRQVSKAQEAPPPETAVEPVPEDPAKPAEAPLEDQWVNLPGEILACETATQIDVLDKMLANPRCPETVRKQGERASKIRRAQLVSDA